MKWHMKEICLMAGGILQVRNGKRFWEAFVRGGYAGHGETYLTEEKILWWSHGGELHGESWKRLEFLHKIMLQTPGIGLKFAGTERDDVHGVPEDFMLEAESGYRIYYYSFMQPVMENSILMTIQNIKWK